jgi:hypothetical protein
MWTNDRRSDIRQLEQELTKDRDPGRGEGRVEIDPSCLGLAFRFHAHKE